MAKWAAGEPDDLSWLDDWCATLRGHVAAGRAVRRVRIVSEPLSDYQRWSRSIAAPMVDAGEDIRWLPRAEVSSLALPGNDYYLFDDRLVVFLLYAGSGLATERVTSTDPANLRLCRPRTQGSWRVERQGCFRQLRTALAFHSPGPTVPVAREGRVEAPRKR